MFLRVDHTTHYRYDAPVGYALQQLRLTPKDRPGQQRIHDWTIEVEGGFAEVNEAVPCTFGETIPASGRIRFTSPGN